MNLSPQARALMDAIDSGEAKHWPHSRIQASRPAAIEALSFAEAELAKTRADKAMVTAIVDGLKDWMSGDVSCLSANEHSRAHSLYAALDNGSVIFSDGSFTQRAADDFLTAQVFVVRHDWAGALGDAIENVGNEFSLPFDSCVFEFVINGKCVIVWAVQPIGDTPKAVPFVKLGDTWYCSGKDSVGPGSPFHFAWTQIIAICVALDAEVATHEVVRAPVALNRKREKQGKTPLRDFHIVDLAKRHRVIGPCTGTHRRHRLHFRRGHWRHYSDHKTWIKWTLVGNPDLGFVEKEYRV